MFYKPNAGSVSTMDGWSILADSLWNMLFINQTTLGSMWYMPMILCLYLLIPLFAIVVKKVSLKSLRIPILAAIGCGMLIPNLNEYFAIIESDYRMNSAISIGNLFSIYFIYVFIGYYVGNNEIVSEISTGWLAFLTMLAFMFCCGYQYFAYRGPTNYLVSYDLVGILICATLLFEFIKRVAGYFTGMHRGITYISKISFGIYFVHIIIMEILNWYVDFSGYHRCMKLLLLELISMVGSVIVISLLSKIPLFKKYLFMIKEG